MRRTIVLLVAALALAPLTLAQSDASARGESQVLSEKLDEVLVLLRELVDVRRGEASLRRTELALRALQSRQGTIQRLQGRERGLKDRLADDRMLRETFTAEIESIEEQAAALQPGSAFEATARQNIARLETQIDALDDRIAATEAEIDEIGLGVLDAEQGLLRLQEIVEEGLEGL